MNLRIIALMLLLAGLLPTCAAEAAALRVSNDGLFRASFATGETTWSGACVVDHPRFHLELTGTVKLFGGPVLRRTSAATGSLKNATFDTETQWISLVALGPGTVKLLDEDGNPAVVAAQRVVYVPASDQLLLDGKAWRFPDQKPE